MEWLKALNEVGIPKIFWYSISFSLVTLTCSLVWIMSRSQSVNIDIADTKIQMLHSISNAEIVLEQAKSPVPPAVSSTRPNVKVDELKIEQINQTLEQLKTLRQNIK